MRHTTDKTWWLLLFFSCVFCYVTAVRGVTLKVVILEEATFIHPDVLDKLVIPLMIMVNFVVIGISSAGDNENYYSRLLDLKDEDGKNVFVVITKNTACKACIAAGIASRCEHKKLMLPSWHSAKQRDVMKRMLGDSGAADFERENMGVVTSSNSTFVFRDFLDNYKKAPVYELRSVCKLIWIALDPHGGGASSHYAAVAITVERGLVVVGYECFICRSHTVEIIKHFMYKRLNIGGSVLEATMCTAFQQTNKHLWKFAGPCLHQSFAPMFWNR